MMSKASYSKASMKNQRTLDIKFPDIKNKIEICSENFYGSPSSQPTFKYKKIKSNKKIESISEKLSVAPIPYVLYMYRKELKRRQLDIIHLSKTKINLTDGLVIKTVKGIHDCLFKDGISGKTFKKQTDVLTRKIIYKNKLQDRIHRLEKHLMKKEQQKQKDARKEFQNKIEQAILQTSGDAKQ